MDGTDQVTFTISLDADEIVAKLLTSLDHDKLLQIIKELDAGVQDWDFTLELADHFEQQRSQWEAEQDEEAMERAAVPTMDIRPPKEVLPCGCGRADAEEGLGHYDKCPITVSKFSTVIAERKQR